MNSDPCIYRIMNSDPFIYRIMNSDPTSNDTTVMIDDCKIDMIDIVIVVNDISDVKISVVS